MLLYLVYPAHLGHIPLIPALWQLHSWSPLQNPKKNCLVGQLAHQAIKTQTRCPLKHETKGNTNQTDANRKYLWKRHL